MEYPVCKNSDELQSKIAANTLRFVSAAPSEKGKVAEDLIPEYENIFCIDGDNSHILRDLESDVDQLPKNKLSSEFLTETADSIAYLCDGLPDAAVKIQNMYETSGNYKLSLLWAIVAYRFGLLRAEDAIGRLLVAMRY